MTVMHRGCFFALVLAIVSSCVARAADWPQWRGPYFNGSTDEKDLPSQWSTTENIAWSAALPGSSAATPIVWQDRVFLSGVDADKDMLQASCFSRADGKLLWRHDIAKGIRRDERSTYAAPSPVTDGKIVVFFYGNGELACFDLDGNRRWARNIAERLRAVRLPVDLRQQPPAVRRQAVSASAAARRGGRGPRPDRSDERVVSAGHGPRHRQDALAAGPPQRGPGRIARGVHHAHSLSLRGPRSCCWPAATC